MGIPDPGSESACAALSRPSTGSSVSKSMSGRSAFETSSAFDSSDCLPAAMSTDPSESRRTSGSSTASSRIFSGTTSKSTSSGLSPASIAKP